MNSQPQVLDLTIQPRIPAPAAWARIDAAPHLFVVDVTVDTPAGRTSYCREVYSVSDAYEEAFKTYSDCTSIQVIPAKFRGRQ